MSKETLKILSVVASGASILFAIGSALCWWRSSTVAIPHAHAKGSGMFYDGTIAIDGNDLFKTMRAQARWGRLGAMFAALSVFFQAASSFVPAS